MIPAKTYHGYPSTLFETGTGSSPGFPRLFLSSLTNLYARTDWNPSGLLSSRTFNRYRLIHCHSKPASPHRTSSSQFIDTTFEKAKPNVRINGKNFEDLKDEDDGTSSTQDLSALTPRFISYSRVLNLDREVEPFDEALDRETWSLYNQRLQWDLELATKRRNRPKEVVDLLENLFKVQDAALGELDKPVEEDEDRPDASLPDGEFVVPLVGHSLIFACREYTRRDERYILQGGCLV